MVELPALQRMWSGCRIGDLAPGKGGAFLGFGRLLFLLADFEKFDLPCSRADSVPARVGHTREGLGLFGEKPTPVVERSAFFAIHGEAPVFGFRRLQSGAFDLRWRPTFFPRFHVREPDSVPARAWHMR